MEKSLGSGCALFSGPFSHAGFRFFGIKGIDLALQILSEHQLVAAREFKFVESHFA